MSVEIARINDLNVNLDLTLEQYKEKAKYLSLISSFNDQLQKIENALFEIRDNFWLDTAIGVQLDAIGSIFNIQRTSLDDEIYRADIRSKAVSSTSGTPNEILSILLEYGYVDIEYLEPKDLGIPAAYAVVLDAGFNVGVLELAEGELLLTEGTLELSYPIDGSSFITQKQLEDVSPAGVECIVASDLVIEDDYYTELTTESGLTLIVY